VPKGVSFYALRSGLCVATNFVLPNPTAPKGFYALRSGLCVATQEALDILARDVFLCPPKRAMRSDDFLDSTHGSIPMGFYALRSGLCVATEELKNAGETNLEFLCPPKRAMRSDGARTAAWCCAAAFLCPPKRAMRSDVPNW